MIDIEATETIDCAPGEVLEFVMDPKRYAEADDMIGEIDWVRRDGDVTEFRFRGKLPGLPGPAPKLTSRMRRTPGERVDAGPPPIPENRLVNRMARISASWVCEPVGDATRVTRVQRMEFSAPMKWLAEPVLKRRMPAQLEKELRRAKACLERSGRD